VGFFRSPLPVFRAIGDALGFVESDSATTEYENGPVRPRLNVQASIESGAVKINDFILSRTDAGGGANTTVDVNVHDLADWTEIRNRASTFVGVAGSEVPPGHDAWIIRVGVMSTAGAVVSSCEVFTDAPTVVAGFGGVPLYFANTPTASGLMLLTTGLNVPILLPLPWFVPRPLQKIHDFRFRLTTTGVNTTNLTFTVLSAPQGVFRKLY